MPGRYGAKKYKPHKSSVSKLIYTAVYRCDGCGAQYRKKPGQCADKNCGGMAFTHFHSITEANRWSLLLILQAQGRISNLRRQVRIPLHAAGINGKTKVCTYVLDFRYDRDAEDVWEDTKGGMTDVASLKLKWVKAEYGVDVLLTK